VHYISKALREYEAESGRLVPTRGTVHDLGPSVSHKAEVIRRWLRNESPAQIARTLYHSQEAVDRYIADFEKVRLLAQKFVLADLPALTGKSPSLVQEYIALLRQYEPELTLYLNAEEDIVVTGETNVVAAASERKPGARSCQGNPKGERGEALTRASTWQS
jgi:hypothetical protein